MSLSVLLEKIGPCLSSKLSVAICETEQITPSAARKRIERAKSTKEIFSIPGIRFRHNEQFVFLESHAHTEKLQRALFSALMECNSIYRLPLLGVAARGGVVSNELYPTYSGLPLSARKGRQNCYAALDHLKNAELLIQNNEIGRIYLSAQYAPNRVSEARRHSRVIAENLLLIALRDWFQLQGLFSKEKFSIREYDKCPQFGYYQWDLVGPSYTVPIATHPHGELLPGFIVADAILGRQLSLADVSYFISKVNSIRANPNNRPCLAILFAEWFDKDALHEGRKNGLLFTTPKNFFGRLFGELLDDLIQAFEQKDTFLEAEPDYLLKIISNICAISHLQEAANSANQQLFTLLVGHCFSTLHGGRPVYDVMLNQSLSIDVCVETERSLVACEAKWQAEQTPLEIDSIQKWLSSLPGLFTSLKLYSKQPGEVILCTNRTFSQQTLNALNETELKYPIAYFDGPALREMMASIDPTLEEIIPGFAIDRNGVTSS